MPEDPETENPLGNRSKDVPSEFRPCPNVQSIRSGHWPLLATAGNSTAEVDRGGKDWISTEKRSPLRAAKGPRLGP